MTLVLFSDSRRFFQYKISPLFFDCFPKSWWSAPKKWNCDFEFAFISNHHLYIVCQVINDSIFYKSDLMNSRFWELITLVHKITHFNNTTTIICVVFSRLYEIYYDNYTEIHVHVGQSVGVTTTIQLVWLNWLMVTQPSHWPQKLCNQKDTHLKLCK